MNKVKPLEFFLFRNYILSVRNWLRENTYLSTYKPEENITVAYMTPERAFAKFIYPVINGATFSPNINFVLNNIEYSTDQNLLGRVKNYNGLNVDKTRIKEVKPLLIYKLGFTCTIFTRNLAEMDVILYQIMTKTSQNNKSHFNVDGQWAELSSENPTNDTNLEPADRQDILHRWGINLSIPRAYLPIENREVPTIMEVDDFYRSMEAG